MKRFHFICLVTLLSICAYAQQNKAYKIDFSICDCSIEQADGICSIVPTTSDFHMIEDTDMPAVPYKTINILIPFGQDLDDYTVSYTVDTVYNDIKLYNNTDVVPTGTEANSSPLVLSTTSVSSPVYGVNVNTYCGYNYASFIVTPYLYDAEKETLYFIKNIDISIKTTYAESPTRVLIYDEEKYKNICGIVFNKEEATSYSTPMEDAETTSATVALEYEIPSTEYVIITESALEEQFERLANWKRQKGVFTKVVSVDSIYDNYTGETEQLKIKNFLADKYSQGLRYVLFGGDVDVILKRHIQEKPLAISFTHVLTKALIGMVTVMAFMVKQMMTLTWYLKYTFRAYL